jgi:hypothetical protein
MLSETITMPPIAANMQSRLTFSSGSIVLVSHPYAAHAHQTAARIRIPSPRPAQSPWCATVAVTWVNERTKTRSKKSSSGVTRSSPPD